jgi:DNA-binding NarL/FixJ family response regulator
MSGAVRQQRQAANDQKPLTPWEFLSVGNWLTRDLPRPESLLGDLIVKGVRGFIGGPTGLGKSHLAMAMAGGMATGQGFQHWPASRPCRVLYLDGEMPRDLGRERLEELVERTPPEHRPALRSNMVFLSTDDCDEFAKNFPQLGKPQYLNSEAGQEFILNLIDTFSEIDAVFFDNRMSLLSGSMAEEQPWKETMPLVQEITRRGIAQIWIDHTGHDTGRIYGTKTKEWAFDFVALMSRVDRPDTDISFHLTFDKARRRLPTNRADFAKTTFAMVNDAWIATPAEEGGVSSAKGLTPAERGWLADIHDAFANPATSARRRPVSEVASGASGASGPMVLAMDREAIRDWLRQKGRFALKPDAALTGADREKMRAIFNGLKDKGKIGMSRDFIWLLEPRQSASGSRQADAPA